MENAIYWILKGETRKGQIHSSIKQHYRISITKVDQPSKDSNSITFKSNK